MRLEQLIFQGVLDQSSPAKLQFGDKLSRVSLPDGISVSDARSLLLNLLYPNDCSSDERQPVERSSDPRLALVFKSGGNLYRIVRKRATNSVRVQVRKDGGWQTAAKGVSKSVKLLDSKLGRPSLRVFRALNLWDFEGAASEKPSDFTDPREIGPEAVEMVDEYEKALEIEELEKKKEKLEQNIQQLRDKYGKGLEVEEKLEQARERLANIELTEIDSDDLEMVRNKQERVAEYEAQLSQLDENEDEEREKVEKLEPQNPWQNNALWAGLAAGVVAIVISLTYGESARWIIMFDSVGFGVVAWTFLKYLTDREKVNIHKVRIESIKRRISEVRREMVEFHEKVDHLLVHANADSEQQLVQRQRKTERLEEMVVDLEDKAERLANNEKYQQARERLEALEEEHAELMERREQLPDYAADLFHLENELRAVGVEPKAALRAREREESPDEEISSFELLAEIADELGYWTAGKLDKKPQKLWRKMLRHILGDDFQDLQIGQQGELTAEGFSEAEDFDTWLQRHRDEREMIAGTLALALHLRSASSDERVDTVYLEEPRERYPAAIAEGLIDVFKGATKRADFALLRG